MRTISHAATLLFVAVAGTTSANAQILRGDVQDSVVIEGSPRHSEFARHSSGGVSFIQVRPVGELSNNIGFGYGATGNYIYRLDRAGIAGMRLAGSISEYGQERIRAPLSYAVGGRIQVDVTTTNTIGTLTIGPQFMVPEGPIRPYAHAGGGFIWFATTSSVQGIDDYEDEFQTRNYSDWTPTWTVGAGVHVPITKRKATILLDLGADFFFGGDASYLRKGSIVDLPNGEIQINPLYSETGFLNVFLGLRITP
jgi:hypothetical protein